MDGDLAAAYDAWLADLKPLRTLAIAVGAFIVAALLVGVLQVSRLHVQSEINLALALLASAILAIRFATRPKALRDGVMLGRISRRNAISAGFAVGVVNALVQVAMRIYQYHGPIHVGAFALAFGFVAVPFAAVDYAVFFQGLLQTRLTKWVGPVVAVVLVVGASLAVFTPHAPIETLSAVIVALGPTMLMLRTRSMLSCIIAYGTQLLLFTLFECAAYLAP